MVFVVCFTYNLFSLWFRAGPAYAANPGCIVGVLLFTDLHFPYLMSKLQPNVHYFANDEYIRLMLMISGCIFNAYNFKLKVKFKYLLKIRKYNCRSSLKVKLIFQNFIIYIVICYRGLNHIYLYLATFQEILLSSSGMYCSICCR